MQLELVYSKSIPAWAQELFTNAIASQFASEQKLPCRVLDCETLEFQSLRHGQHARIWLSKYSREIARVELCVA